MTQQLFPISGRRPRVVITRLAGNLSVQPWEAQAIGIETTEPIVDLRQEGDTLIITDCQSDLVLQVPAMKKLFAVGSIYTDIIGTQLSRSATIEGVGNVELQDVGGSVTLVNIEGNIELEGIREVAELTNIGGNVSATDMPRLLAHQSIGGNATLSTISWIELEALGGNLSLSQVETVTLGTVGGNLDADNVRAMLHCRRVGGNCYVTQSENPEISINSVGGNLEVMNASHVQTEHVGGNLTMRANFPTESRTHLHVGGNANVGLPENPNLSISAFAGGNISSQNATFKQGGGFVTLVYGDGTATLDIRAGGNLKLLGSASPRSTISH